MSQTRDLAMEQAKELTANLKKAQVPFFISIYLPGEKKYCNACFLPEEVTNPSDDVREQNGKFKNYLRDSLDICKEEYRFNIG
jgi:hypothetical protein